MASQDSITPADGAASQSGDVDLSDDVRDELVRQREADARAWLQNQSPATGHRQARLTRTWRVTLGLLARGVDADQAVSLMLSEFNPRCSPPWEPREVEDTCQRAAVRRGGSGSMMGTTVTPKVATPEQLDLAYRTVLSRTRLTMSDRSTLHARGFTDEEVARLGYSSWNMALNAWYATIDEIQKHLGDATFNVPGIVQTAVRPEFNPRTAGPLVPVRDFEGRVVGLRVRHEWQVENKAGMPILDKDGKPKREKTYLWFSGRDRKDHPDDARAVACLHVPLHDGLATSVIRFTEGEYKADFATLRTCVLTVSIPGVGSWRLALDAVTKLGVKTALIAFDADCESNEAVARAIVELAQALRSLNVEVKIETWPITAGKGIDDVIRNGHTNQIRVLEGDEASEWLNELARNHGLPGRTDIDKLFDDIQTEAEATNVVRLQVVRSAKPKNHHRTDLGNAGRFVDQHGDDIRFCVPWKKWLCWDGTRWKVDDTQQVERWAHETVRSIYAEAGREADLDKRKALVGHAIHSESVSRITAMITLAEALVPIRPEEFDQDHWLLNVQNGTIDLKTGKLRDHQRNDFITRLAPVEFDPAADRSAVDRFLEVVQPEAEMRAYLWRRWGYCLTGDTCEHFIAIDYGSGRNGKSTADNAVQKVLGDYAVQVPTELLLDRPGAHPTDRTTLHGKRFAVATETEEGARLNVSLIKQLTGGDPISARRMREDFWTFLPTHKLTLVTNHKPQIRETKDAIWRRVHLIPWAVQIAKGKEDKTLAEKLPGPGLLRALVEGCLDYQAKKELLPPRVVIVATHSYREESDLLAGFIVEHLIEDPKTELEFRALYALYKSWAEEGGHKPMSQKRLTGELDERGLGQSIRSSRTGRMVRVGVKQRLHDDGDDDALWADPDPSILQPDAAPTQHESCRSEGSEGSEGRSGINAYMEPREGEIRDLPSNPSIVQDGLPAVVTLGTLLPGTHELPVQALGRHPDGEHAGQLWLDLCAGNDGVVLRLPDSSEAGIKRTLRLVGWSPVKKCCERRVLVQVRPDRTVSLVGEA